MRAPETCPNCGADVPPNARACPECGSCEATGWGEAADTSGLDLPGEDGFNNKEFTEREFGAKPPVPRGLHWFWWLVALLLLALFVARFL